MDALRWRALAQQAKDECQRIHFKVLFEALKDLEKQWDKDLLSSEEVRIRNSLQRAIHTLQCLAVTKFAIPQIFLHNLNIVELNSLSQFVKEFFFFISF